MEPPQCARCGICLPTCPTYTVEMQEASGPRGRLLLLKSLAEGEVKDVQGLREPLYTCTLCGACQDACPQPLPIVDAIRNARAHLVSLGVEPPEAYRRVRESMQRWGNPLGVERTEAPAWDAEKTECVLFSGCVATYLRREVLDAAEAVLEAAGIKHTTLKGVCCGAPLLRAGYVEDARRLAEENMRRLGSRINGLIVLCPHCQRAFMEDYKLLVGTSMPAVHITQLVDRLISEGRLKLEEGVELRVAYHDPCNLGRGLGVYEEPRRVLQSIPEMRLVELKHNRGHSLCCGGAHPWGYPKLSMELARKRVQEALSVGADVLATSCPHCYQSLLNAALHHARELTVASVVEVAAEAVRR